MVPHMTHDAVLLVSAVVHPEVLKLYNEIRTDGEKFKCHDDELQGSYE